MSLPDISIPGFRMLHPIGHGAMSRVYLAEQEVFGRQVAIKLMSRELAENEQFGERFLREARLIAALGHKNIVQVYDAGCIDGDYYLAMEHLAGGDLRSPAAERVPVPDVLTVLLSVLDALSCAAAHGVVHRDVKPANIMLRRDGTVVLLDFGIARDLATETRVTQVGTLIGTPHYMSPEQFQGADVDHRSDIYSVGVVFYELLTGDVPYTAETATAIGIKHISEPVPRLPAEQAALQPLLDRALAKEKSQRFQSAEDFAEALLALEAALPTAPIGGSAGAGAGSRPFAEASQRTMKRGRRGPDTDRGAVAAAPRLPGLPRAATLSLLALAFLLGTAAAAWRFDLLPGPGTAARDTQSAASATRPGGDAVAAADPAADGQATAAQARQRADTAARRYLELAERALARNEYDSAVELASLGLDEGGSLRINERLVAVGARGRRLGAEAGERASLREQLMNQLAAGELYAPDGDNAYATLAALGERGESTDFLTAQTRRLDQRVTARIDAHIDDGALDTAQAVLDAVDGLAADNALADARQRLATARSARVRQRRALVQAEGRARDSAAVLASLDDARRAIDAGAALLELDADNDTARVALGRVADYLRERADTALAREQAGTAGDALALFSQVPGVAAGAVTELSLRVSEARARSERQRSQLERAGRALDRARSAAQLGSWEDPAGPQGLQASRDALRLLDGTPGYGDSRATSSTLTREAIAVFETLADMALKSGEVDVVEAALREEAANPLTRVDLGASVTRLREALAEAKTRRRRSVITF